MSRVVITTAGSLGDLFPFVAIGLELRNRGHDVVIAPRMSKRLRFLGRGFWGPLFWCGKR